MTSDRQDGIPEFFSGKPDPKIVFLISLLLFLGSFLLYLPVASFDFLNYDDQAILLNHPNLYNSETIGESLAQIFYEYYPREEPLIVRDLSWLLDSKVYGFNNSFGFHLTNLMLNSLNMILLFYFLFRFTRNLGFSLLTASIWAVLAIRVEPIAWIMGRKDLLTTMFMLITLHFFLTWLEGREQGKGRIFYLLTVPTTAVALLSKINSVVFFGVLAIFFLLYEFYRNKKDFTLDNLIRLVPRGTLIILPHLIISLITYVWYKGVLEDFGVLDSNINVTREDHLYGFFTFNPLVIGVYLKNIFLPYKMSGFYSWPSLFYPLSTMQHALSAGIFLGGLGFAAYLFLREKILFLVFAIFVCFMVPYSNIFYIGIWVANRYLYFSSLCLVIITVVLLYRLYAAGGKPTRFLVVSFVVAWFGINVVQTIIHIPNWKNNHAFGTHEMSLSYPSENGFIAAGSHYLDLAQYSQDTAVRKENLAIARKIMERGVALFEKTPSGRPSKILHKFYYGMGTINELEGNEEKAIEWYKKSSRFNVTFSHVNIRISQIYYQKALNERIPMNRQNYAYQALNYYKAYYLGVKRDPYAQQNVPESLERFKKDFPFLERSVQELLDEINEK